MLVPTTAPSTARRLAHAQSLELGRLRYERTLLLQQVLAVHNGLEDGTATAAWRALLRTARWLEADDAVRALEVV